MTRSDIHSPVHMDPASYTHVGPMYQGSYRWFLLYLKRTPADLAAYHAAMKALESKPFHGNHFHKGTCDHCGAAFDYGHVYQHTPTKEYVCIGHICAAERFSLPDKAAWDLQRLKKGATTLKKQEKWNKLRDERREALFSREPDLRVIFPESGNQIVAKYGNTKMANILLDFHNKLYSGWGDLWPSQIDLARKMVKEHAEMQTKPEVIEGQRILIVGRVKSLCEKDGQFGRQWKMAIEEMHGYCLYGTCPSALLQDTIKTGDSGDYVRFFASVVKSNRDGHFGFWSRPTQAQVIPPADAIKFHNSRPGVVKSTMLVASQTEAEKTWRSPGMVQKEDEVSDKMVNELDRLRDLFKNKILAGK